MIVHYELVGSDPARPFSPHCWKTAMALRHKGLEYRLAPTLFLDVATVEGGGWKTIPVIRDGEAVIRDSFDIALYLDRTYPDRPSLFGGPGGEAMARFVERWSQGTIHLYLGSAAILDILALLDEPNARYFRESREARFGKPLEAVAAVREPELDAFRRSLHPLRTMLGFQPFIGGEAPLFSDYIVFGAFQWARVVSPFPFLDGGDPVRDWFERCLDLHGGFGRTVAAAA